MLEPEMDEMNEILLVDQPVPKTYTIIYSPSPPFTSQDCIGMMSSDGDLFSVPIFPNTFNKFKAMGGDLSDNTLVHIGTCQISPEVLQTLASMTILVDIDSIAYDHKTLGSKVTPTPSIIEALHSMHDEGHSIFFVTHATALQETFGMSERYQWIEDHLGSKWAQNIIVTEDYTMVHGDVLIDNKPLGLRGHEKPTWKHIRLKKHHWSEWRRILG